MSPNSLPGGVPKLARVRTLTRPTLIAALVVLPLFMVGPVAGASPRPHDSAMQPTPWPSPTKLATKAEAVTDLVMKSTPELTSEHKNGKAKKAKNAKKAKKAKRAKITARAA